VFLKLSTYTFTLFLATRNVLVEVLVGKNQEKTGKEMVSDLNYFAQKWCEIAAAKKVFY
jgi:hypothetical protein